MPNPNIRSEGKPFQKGHDPRRNTTGKNKKRVTEFLEEFGEAESIAFDIVVVKNGVPTKITGEIKNNDQKTINQLIAVRLLQKAASGDLRAIKEVLDRTEGAARQPIELENGIINVDYTFND